MGASAFKAGQLMPRRPPLLTEADVKRIAKGFRAAGYEKIRCIVNAGVVMIEGASESTPFPGSASDLDAELAQFEARRGQS